MSQAMTGNELRLGLQVDGLDMTILAKLSEEYASPTHDYWTVDAGTSNHNELSFKYCGTIKVTKNAHRHVVIRKSVGMVMMKIYSEFNQIRARTSGDTDANLNEVIDFEDEDLTLSVARDEKNSDPFMDVRDIKTGKFKKFTKE